MMEVLRGLASGTSQSATCSVHDGGIESGWLVGQVSQLHVVCMMEVLRWLASGTSQ